MFHPTAHRKDWKGFGWFSPELEIGSKLEIFPFFELSSVGLLSKGKFAIMSCK